MNRKIKLVFVALLGVLMTGGVWWTRELASWRPQLIGNWPELRSYQNDFVYDVVHQRSFRALSMGRAFTTEAEFSPDNALLSVCDSQGEAEESGCWVADIGANRKLGDFNGQNLNFSPDSQTILIDNWGAIELHSARTGSLIRRWKRPFDVSNLAFARDGNAFYATTDKGQIWKIRIR